MKGKIIWLIFIILSIVNTGLFSDEYVRSIKQLTFEDSIDYYPYWSLI